MKIPWHCRIWPQPLWFMLTPILASKTSNSIKRVVDNLERETNSSNKKKKLVSRDIKFMKAK